MSGDWTAVLREPPKHQDLGSCSIAYRIIGSGEPLVFITGWPFNQSTYYNLMPYLVDDFSCILLDSPGLGQTIWRDNTDFTFPGQAKTFERFLEALQVDACSVVAHDTGATIARLLVADNLDKVHKFVILNTEIPNERPPWFPLYARLMKLPLARVPFQLALRSRSFLKSPMGFGGAYDNNELINDRFIARYIQPVVDDPHRYEGLSRYLRIGLDFTLIDALPEVHERITIPVHFVWGAEDPTFPIEPARRMMTDFPNCEGMTEVPKGKLLSHDEFPEVTAEAIKRFLQQQTS
ncbi:MAG: alpha/beta fold hydrolase [Acidimicrobiales bacterium]